MSNNSAFDLGVIGGGIAGAGIARDAALRGLSVVLFEKNTFGSGTSSKSSKLIHGGIRYLDVAWSALKRGDLREAWKNFRFVILSLRESRILEKIAPHLVQPISLVIPIYKESGRNRFAIYFGTLFYSLLSIFMGNLRWPRILDSPQAVLKWIPNLRTENLAGGVLIWDHWTRDKMLVEKTVASAVRAGTKAFEHTKVLTYRYDREKNLYELTVEKDGKESCFWVRKLVNAAGPWVDQVREAAHEKNGDQGDFLVPVAGSHITFQKFVSHSVILQAEDERVFFVINIDDTSRVGTTERLHHDPDHTEPQEEEVEYLLRSLRKYFPAVNFRKEDILSQDCGIRPLARPKNELSPHHISREHEVRIGPTGVLHVLGVKLTDHRRAAEDIVNRIVSDRSLKTLTHRLPLA